MTLRTQGALRTRRCSVCGRTLPTDAFVRNRTKVHGISNECRECLRERTRDHYRNDGYWTHREEGWKRRGIVEADGRPLRAETYRAVLSFVGRKCELCGVNETWGRLAADHAHEPPFVFRGILCEHCNRRAVGSYERYGHYRSAVHEQSILAYLESGGYARWRASAEIVLEVN